MDVYTMVTERIIKKLESGVIPWNKPWSGTYDGAYNRFTKKPYSLINQLLLENNGEYATFKQWTSIGGKIKKGSKSEIVVFWNLKEYERENEKGEKEIKTIPILKYYNVFHISQVEGVEPLKEEELNQIEPIQKAEEILKDYIKREHIKLIIDKSDKAFYSPTTDSINLPLLEQFKNAEEFYSTAFHECTHSTMKESRCNRIDENRGSHFGNEAYSKEELVAELGASTILNHLGIESNKSFENSTAYIQSWVRVLKNDKKFIVSASSKAEKAVNYILNVA